MSTGRTFFVPEAFSPADLRALVNASSTLEESGVETCKAQYFDTFDWLLQQEGLALCRRGSRFEFGPALGGEVAEAVVASRKSRLFWRDFPEGGLRDRLRQVITVRALLPQFTLRRTLHSFNLLNSDEKTVVRLRFCIDRHHHQPKASPSLPMILQVEPLRGYEEPFDEVCRVLSGAGFSEPDGGYDLVAAVQQLRGIDPQATSSKFAVELASGASVGEAVRDICLHLRATMLRNLEGTVEDIDSEFLHDLRVAVRRTRSLLALLKKRLPVEEIGHYQTGFKWLGTITGPVRDLDVYLLKEEEYRAILPPELQAGVSAFFASLTRRRKRELRRMRKQLRSPRLADLLAGWQSFLDEFAGREGDDRSNRPCRELVSGIIRKRVARILRHGRAITAESPAEQLHELRIECKKYRYLLEFFRSLYDGEQVDAYLRQMKQLQNILGDFNDLAVQKQVLLGQLGQLGAARKIAVDTAGALGGLVVHLHEQQRQVRGQFAQAFGEFASFSSAELLAAILESSGEASLADGD